MIAERHRVLVRGVVQGVGFRPFVHRLACELGLTGHVGNDAAQVFIEVEGPAGTIAGFLRRLRADAPPLSMIESIDDTLIARRGDNSFHIVASVGRAGAVTLVPPDVAVCDECVGEMNDPTNRRFGHPFVTCTNCGPRFTIIRQLPYDRPNTTMSGFDMCARCAAEYDNPADRRYHAQPIGCLECGPTLSLRVKGQLAIHGTDAAGAAQRALSAGRLLAVKGVGGYHLMCSALSDDAVSELRRRKGRADKPFAVMVADLDAVREVAALDDDEAEQLVSGARPIVLLRAGADSPLSVLVAPGNPLIGVMLPYTPLHHLLFRRTSDEVVPAALVMTSGNRSGEPIAFRDDDARQRLGDIVDGFLTHDRPIHMPCDDSVVRVVDGELLPIRRSRGYAPMPVRLPWSGPDVLAVGGELKNTFCVTTGRHAWVSQHIGDMENLETVEAFEAAVGQFCDLYRIAPTVVVTDGHPGYRTARWARERFGPSVTEAQHHHAHIAAVLAEHGRDPTSDVIGVAFDGTGYGADGTIWGGEIMVANAERFERRSHLRCVPLPGGDSAIRHPSRVALAHLWAAGVEWTHDLPPVASHSELERNLLRRQFETGVGCVPTSSMGRLFDAISSLVGLRHTITYEAQAAIDLEVVAEGHMDHCPEYHFGLVAGGQIDAAPVVAAVAADVRNGCATGAIAAGFHHAVVEAIVAAAAAVRAEQRLDVVVLTGGVFQNVALVRCARRALLASGFEVLTHRIVPPNDGGLALGQAYIASHRSFTDKPFTDKAG